MRMFRVFALNVCVACLVMGIGCTTQQPAAPDPSKSTLDNLQAAYNGESNAGAKYAVYAKKADEQGNGQAASLFRAASRAEQIHALNHADVIKSMGAKPVCDIKTPQAKDTKDNLKDAIAGESYERDTMYPAFIAKAKAEKNTQAVRTFDYALAAEAEHAKLYADALTLAAKGKSANMTFYVCPKCGHTATKVFGKCPECGCKADAFEAIK